MKRSQKQRQSQKPALIEEKPQADLSSFGIPDPMVVPTAGVTGRIAKIAADCSQSNRHTQSSHAVRSARLPSRAQQLKISYSPAPASSVARDSRRAHTADGSAFLCAQCSALLSRKQGLVRHIREIHTSTGGARCPHCDKVFPLAVNLNIHIGRLHSDEKGSAVRPLRFPCKYCPASFKSAWGQQYHHTKAHVGQPSNASLAGMSACICALCLMAYENRSQLYIHLHKLCPVSVRRYKCQQCASAYKTQTGLKYHLLSHLTSAAARKHRCPKCFAAFKSVAEVRSHQTVHLTEKSFACRDCVATFTTLKYLHGHQKRSHCVSAASKRFKCPHCSKSLKSSETLRVHVASVHYDSQRFGCAICLTMLKYRSSIELHLSSHYKDGPDKPRLSIKRQRRQLSIDEKVKRRAIAKIKREAKKSQLGDSRPFLCVQCQKTFKSRQNLRAHELVHADERSYLCDRCPAAFKGSDGLKRHLLLHSAERPSFSCELCPSSYPTRSLVKRHQRAHFANLEFACSSCSASYDQLSSLTRHERIHETDFGGNDETKAESALVFKPKCKDCGLSFANSISLAQHVRNKHLDAPTAFKCARCSRVTAFKNGLSRHIWMMHTRLDQPDLMTTEKLRRRNRNT